MNKFARISIPGVLFSIGFFIPLAQAEETLRHHAEDYQVHSSIYADPAPAPADAKVSLFYPIAYSGVAVSRSTANGGDSAAPSGETDSAGFGLKLNLGGFRADGATVFDGSASAGLGAAGLRPGTPTGENDKASVGMTTQLNAQIDVLTRVFTEEGCSPAAGAGGHAEYKGVVSSNSTAPGQPAQSPKTPAGPGSTEAKDLTLEGHISVGLACVKGKMALVFVVTGGAGTKLVGADVSKILGGKFKMVDAEHGVIAYLDASKGFQASDNSLSFFEAKTGIMIRIAPKVWVGAEAAYVTSQPGKALVDEQPEKSRLDVTAGAAIAF